MKNLKINLNLKVIFLLILSSVLFCGEISWSNSSKTIGACRSYSPDQEENEILLSQKAEELFEQRKYCEAAASYLKLSILATHPEKKFSYLLKQIESFFNRYDYEAFYERSLKILDAQTGYIEIEERLLYLIAKALFEQSLEWKDLSNPALQYALGIHPEQLAENSIKNKMKLRYFIETFPRSIYVNEVMDMQKQLRQEFNQDYASKARRLWSMRDYAPAISRYQFLISQGPQTKDSDLYHFELLSVLGEFEFWVHDKVKIPDFKLARWMGLIEEEITTELRAKLKAQLFTQRVFMIKRMQEIYPQSDWTRKAKMDNADLKEFFVKN